MTSSSPAGTASPLRTALVIAVAYVLLGTAWILSSDKLVTLVSHGSVPLAQLLQNIKGLAYIVTTGGALFSAIWWSMRRHERILAEKRRAEELFSIASRFETMGQLAGNLAHDFNNVLTVIGLSIFDPAKPKDPDDPVQASIAAARASIAALMKFARRESLEFCDLDCARHLEDSRRILQQALGARVRLDLRVPDEPLIIWGLPNMMTQALLNLATNARDAMEHSRTKVFSVHLSCVRLSDYQSKFRTTPVSGVFACLRVRDTGCGIPPEHIARIFEPLFTTKAPSHGTGLGLASVSHLIVQLKGWIEVESQVGAGTEFAIFVPALDPKV